jgi:hypothetical protein
MDGFLDDAAAFVKSFVSGFTNAIATPPRVVAQAVGSKTAVQAVDAVTGTVKTVASNLVPVVPIQAASEYIYGKSPSAAPEAAAGSSAVRGNPLASGFQRAGQVVPGGMLPRPPGRASDQFQPNVTPSSVHPLIIVGGLAIAGYIGYRVWRKKRLGKVTARRARRSASRAAKFKFA